MCSPVRTQSICRTPSITKALRSSMTPRPCRRTRTARQTRPLSGARESTRRRWSSPARYWRRAGTASSGRSQREIWATSERTRRVRRSARSWGGSRTTSSRARRRRHYTRPITSTGAGWSSSPTAGLTRQSRQKSPSPRCLRRSRVSLLGRDRRATARTARILTAAMPIGLCQMARTIPRPGSCIATAAAMSFTARRTFTGLPRRGLRPLAACRS
mmetsp:Transcript_24091/g.72366  ORF Transcript_24091/g.72366 Transcript_24091/m.72366 type:complete len:215 (-) Transcript_24091:894-1538(-)